MKTQMVEWVEEKAELRALFPSSKVLLVPGSLYSTALLMFHRDVTK